jgi:hypothetical protein
MSAEVINYYIHYTDTVCSEISVKFRGLVFTKSAFEFRTEDRILPHEFVPAFLKFFSRKMFGLSTKQQITFRNLVTCLQQLSVISMVYENMQLGKRPSSRE